MVAPTEAVQQMRFDRVLCDVPCGGDGTLRKSPAKMASWSPASALANHPLQVARSARLVRGERLEGCGCRLGFCMR